MKDKGGEMLTLIQSLVRAKDERLDNEKHPGQYRVDDHEPEISCKVLRDTLDQEAEQS